MYFENTKLCSLIQLCKYNILRYGICQALMARNSKNFSKTSMFFDNLNIQMPNVQISKRLVKKKKATLTVKVLHNHPEMPFRRFL